MTQRLSDLCHMTTGICRLGELVSALLTIKGQAPSPDLNSFSHNSLNPSAVLAQDLNYFVVAKYLDFSSVIANLSQISCNNYDKWQLL